MFTLTTEGEVRILSGSWQGAILNFDPVVENASEHLYDLGYGQVFDEEGVLEDWANLDEAQMLNVIDDYFIQTMLGFATANKVNTVNDARVAAQAAADAEVAAYDFGNEPEPEP